MTEPNKKLPPKSSNTGTNPIGNLVRQAQNKLESSVSSGDHNEAVLQQSQVWVRAVTWSLIGTTVFFIGWLGIARTELANSSLWETSKKCGSQQAQWSKKFL